jgi:hypothetical protein
MLTSPHTAATERTVHGLSISTAQLVPLEQLAQSALVDLREQPAKSALRAKLEQLDPSAQLAKSVLLAKLVLRALMALPAFMAQLAK